jgi:hypothetical protein
MFNIIIIMIIIIIIVIIIIIMIIVIRTWTCTIAHCSSADTRTAALLEQSTAECRVFRARTDIP